MGEDQVLMEDDAPSLDVQQDVVHVWRAALD